MLSNKQEVKVEVKIDLDTFADESGPLVSSNGESLIFNEVDFVRERYVLNHFFHHEYLEYMGKCVSENDVAVLNQRSEYQREIDYLQDLLSANPYGVEYSDEEWSSRYHLDLIKNPEDDKHFVVTIVIKEGFASLMETSPSKMRKTLLQDVLNLLYENGITNIELTRYFLDTSYKHATSI